MNKTLVAVLIASIAVGTYVASPFISVGSLPDTLRSGNVDNIGQAIDFPSVRSNMKNEVKATMMKKITNDPKDNPFSGLVLVMAPAIIDNTIEAMITPQAFVKIIEKSGTNPNGRTLDYDSAGFTGISTFSVTLKNNNKFHFRFTGTGWTLYRVEIKLES